MEDAGNTPNAMANDLFKAFMANPNSKLTIQEMVGGFQKIVATLHTLTHAYDAMDMVRTLLGNGTTVMTLDEMVEGLVSVDRMLSDIQDPRQFLLPAPSQAPAPHASAPETPAAPAALPVMVEEPTLPEPVERLEGDARRAVKGTSIRLRPKPRAGTHIALRIWPDASEDQQAKFMRLIERHRIHQNERGEPIPAKAGDSLVTEDGMRVIDPINGLPYTMLKHHILTDYNLTHAELLMMFKLTPEQLPKTGPGYSAGKARQAKEHGLGKNKPKRLKARTGDEGTGELFESRVA